MSCRCHRPAHTALLRQSVHHLLILPTLTTPSPPDHTRNRELQSAPLELHDTRSRRSTPQAHQKARHEQHSSVCGLAGAAHILLYTVWPCVDVSTARLDPSEEAWALTMRTNASCCSCSASSFIASSAPPPVQGPPPSPACATGCSAPCAVPSPICCCCCRPGAGDAAGGFCCSSTLTATSSPCSVPRNTTPWPPWPDEARANARGGGIRGWLLGCWGGQEGMSKAAVGGMAPTWPQPYDVVITERSGDIKTCRPLLCLSHHDIAPFPLCPHPAFPAAPPLQCPDSQPPCQCWVQEGQQTRAATQSPPAQTTTPPPRHSCLHHHHQKARAHRPYRFRPLPTHPTPSPLTLPAVPPRAS